MCPGPQGGHDHSTSLVGKDENGKWRSAGSDEYTSNLCGRLAHIVLDPNDVLDPYLSNATAVFALAKIGGLPLCAMLQRVECASLGRAARL